MGKRGQATVLETDPRDSAAVREWKRVMPHPDEAPPDWGALLALILGMCGIFFKVRPALRVAHPIISLMCGEVWPGAPRGASPRGRTSCVRGWRCLRAWHPSQTSDPSLWTSSRCLRRPCTRSAARAPQRRRSSLYPRCVPGTGRRVSIMGLVMTYTAANAHNRRAGAEAMGKGSSSGRA